MINHMEATLILVGLIALVLVFGLPIAAWIRIAFLRRELEEVRNELRDLRAEWILSRKQSAPLEPVTESRTAPDPVPSGAFSKPFTPEVPVPAPVAPAVPTSAPTPALAPAQIARAIKTEPAAAPTPPTAPDPVRPVAPAPPPLPPQIPRPSPLPPRPVAPALPSFNWERFMGVKLVAWLGGFALFLAAAYFVKYSFDHDLISPELRAAFGFVLGIGLVVGGFALKRKAYEVTAQTLCASGIVILYSVCFACRAVYHFEPFSAGFTFLLMTLVTVTAFGLSMRMEAPVIAILGMLAGFLTPPMLSTGQDNPLGLFTYITLLNIGLMGVAFYRPWRYLLPLAAIGTVLMEFGWSAKFLTIEKLPIAVTIFLFFPVLFLAGAEWKRRRHGGESWWAWSAVIPTIAALIQAFLCLGIHGYGTRIGLLGLLVLGADLALLAIVVRRPMWWFLQMISGGAAYGFLALWMTQSLTDSLLYWALGWILAFSVLHCGYSAWFMQKHRNSPAATWSHLFPPLALLLVLLPIFKLPEVSILVWPVIFLVDVAAIALAVITGAMWSVLAVLLMTALVAGMWIFQVPADLSLIPWMLVIVGSMAVGFLFAGLYLVRRIVRIQGGDAASLGKAMGGLSFTQRPDSAQLMSQLPAMSALLPFLLLIMVTARLPLTQPSPVFALAMALVILLLSVARTFRQHALVAVGLASVLALETVWLQRHWSADLNSPVALAWFMAFALLFFLFPFFSREQCRTQVLPWAVSALSFPLHFTWIHRVISQTWPNGYMGILPFAFAIPLLLSTWRLSQATDLVDRQKLSVLAWFGGASLFFITLIFPIQFERQWITVAWALEGAALCWLYHRLPHNGLRLAGFALLVVSFVRLSLNPAVLSYHPRSDTPILNWYLYSYGITIVALFAGARLLAPPRDTWRFIRFPAVLSVLGTVLAFLLVNLEIADYFTRPGEAVLTFKFSGNLARDMSYTIAWALFALILVFHGLRRPLRSARYAGLVLLGITLLKLFFHDLAELAQLYRIGALAAVAIIAIAASFLYQKFLAEEPDATQASKPTSPDAP